MTSSLAYLLPMTIPLAYLVLAARLPKTPPRWPTWLAAAPLGLAFACTGLLAAAGEGGSPLLGIVGFGLSFRLDALSPRRT